MSQINFGLLQNGQNSFQNALANGMQAGQAMANAMAAREERKGRNALSEYAANPTREGLGGLAQYQPGLAIQERGRFDQQDAARVEGQRDQLPVISRLLEGVNAENYGQRVSIAQQYGMDISGLPQQFDPIAIGNMQTMARALQTPEGREALSTFGKVAMDRGFQPGTPEFAAEVTRIYIAEQDKTVAYQPGGNVISHNAYTGQSTPLVQGEAAPAQAQPVAREVGGATYYQGPDGTWYDNPQEAMGGGGSNVTSGFPGR